MFIVSRDDSIVNINDVYIDSHIYNIKFSSVN